MTSSPRSSSLHRLTSGELPGPSAHHGLGCGIGLRREHYQFVLDQRPAVPWFEVVTENFMVPGGRPRHLLESVRADYPVGLHGVALSIGSAEPLDSVYMKRLVDLVGRIDPVFVSDHLCWTSLGGHNSHDLLPLPFTDEAVRVAAAKIRQVQDRLGRRILIENISTYLRFRAAAMTEWEFLAAVAEQADCGILLDINNIYVNSRNHRFDPRLYLAGVPADRVAQFHLAGHQDHGDVVIDTHDHPVPDPVWSLFFDAVQRFGPVPAVIERDARIPEFTVLLGEAHLAQRLMDAGAKDALDGRCTA
jgi:uncharacterized protein (UPF0276 family)